MNVIPKSDIPPDIVSDSVLAHLAAAYFSVGKQLERKTGCSATRGFILHALGSGTALNQNQIATILGFDRTVVHRAIKTMVKEGLVSETKATAGKAIPLKLTAKGHRFRERLIEARRAADGALCDQLNQEDRRALVRLLQMVSQLEL